MKYWFQSADFTGTDLEADSPAALEAAFQGRDWAAELGSRQTLEEAGAESCDPGFGVVRDDGRILHLCPQSTGEVNCHYHYSRERRWLGLFSTSVAVVKTWQVDSMAAAQAVLSRFIANDDDWLVRQL